MKTLKKLFIVAVLMLFVVSISGCRKHKKHVWEDATCTSSKVCTECGVAEGKPLGHTWKDATCDASKTCTVCGAVEGAPKGHTWKDATCTTPKTCTTCNKTEGEALGHKLTDGSCTEPKKCTVCNEVTSELGHTWKDATCNAPKTCTKCGTTEGDTLSHIWSEPTYSAPRTCQLCGTTEGLPLTCPGHVDENKDRACDVCMQYIDVKISIALSENEIEKDGVVTVIVNVFGISNKDYTLTVSDETLVKVEKDGDDYKLICIAVGAIDKAVTVTVSSAVYQNVSASKNLIILAEKVDGQVGELTSDMLLEVGNSSITVTGSLIDYYTDFNQAANNSVQEYEMKVMMQEGLWYGEWNIKNNLRSKLVDIYAMGDEDGIMDSYGNYGHALTRVYINQFNEVSKMVEKDYMSFPALWEQQHLWNHLSSLTIDRFEYDPVNNVYEYTYDPNNLSDLYLLTYLSYCLTPMLTDTLSSVYLKVQDGKVTGLIGQTEVIYYGADTQEEADAMSYTVINLEFSNIGSTEVPMPNVYEAPEHVDVLQAALDKMANATNYTYRVTDVTTYAPVTDSGDYEIESVQPSTQKAKALSNGKLKVHNNVSSVGTVGSVGYVTEDAILIADTGKYSSSLDDKVYHTTYTGYKQNNNGTYDYFEYSSTTNSLVGEKLHYGTVQDVLPKFNFSANIFKYSGSTINEQGKEVYTFVLRATDVTREVAKEISAYMYADDASKDSQNVLTIVVDEDGNLVSTVYPYSLVEGTYVGYCSTVFTNVGTTKLDEDLFDDYVPREVPTSWSQTITKYYTTDWSTLTTHEENTQTVIEATYGEKAKDLPSIEIFLEVFGDNLSGPFFDWKSIGTDADGNDINTGWISITTTSSEYDENHKITNYEEIIEKLSTLLLADGFTISMANTDMSGGPLGKSDRFICYIKGDIQIVVENNHTKYFWIDFYKTGEWTLNK